MTQSQTLNKEEKKILGLSALGGMLELYDFAIYGTFAIYFSKQFFPSHNQYITLLETYMIFLLGFILRPIGGIIFSHIGDEIGRKKVLVYTIFLMGLSSLGIACLPTYAQIGVFAPILLLLMRLLQGLAVGGELPTTYVYISEAMSNKRILAFGVTMAGVISGYLFAALINFTLTRLFSIDALNNYAWRIPFFIGGIICFISFKIRQSLRETKAFQEIMSKPKFPLLDVFKSYKPQLVAGIILSATQQIFSIVGIIYMPSYFSSILKLKLSDVGNLMPVALLISVMVIAFAGYACRRLKNINQVMLISLLISLIATVSAFYLIHADLISLGYVVLMVAHGLVALFIPLYITLLFPAHVRLSGVAISYNISAAALGGTAPIAITLLIKQTGLIYLIPAVYISLFLLLAIVGVLWFRKGLIT